MLPFLLAAREECPSHTRWCLSCATITQGLAEGFDHIAAHFIDCILDGVECTAPLRHGLQVQQMMEALLKSASTGREVRLHTSAEEWK